MNITAKDLLRMVVEFLEGIYRTKEETISHFINLGIEGFTETYIAEVLDNYADLLFLYGHTDEATFDAMNQWTSIRSHKQIMTAIMAIFSQEVENSKNSSNLANLNTERLNLIHVKNILIEDENRIVLKMQNSQYKDDDVIAGLQSLLETIQEELANINVKLSNTESQIQRLNSDN